jgi:hypothetical protein
VSPSIRPNGGAIPLWRERGYNVACLRQGEPIDCEVQIPTGEYRGWAPSVNILAKFVIEHDPTADWIVTGGDDYEPDLSRTPESIAQECGGYFRKYVPWVNGIACPELTDDTFGVMQPTGDRWGDTPATRKQYGENRGAYLDRIAGSPWMGREWVKRAFHGRGPMWPEFFHMYADEHLKECAEKLGVYWARRDIVQLHRHWGRQPGEEFGRLEDCPDFLHQVNTPQHWHESQALFNKLKAGGFAEADGW